MYLPRITLLLDIQKMIEILNRIIGMKLLRVEERKKTAKQNRLYIIRNLLYGTTTKHRTKAVCWHLKGWKVIYETDYKTCYLDEY